MTHLPCPGQVIDIEALFPLEVRCGLSEQVDNLCDVFVRDITEQVAELEVRLGLANQDVCPCLTLHAYDDLEHL